MIEKKYCSVCGTELDEQTTALQQLYVDGHFLLSPSKFTRQIDHIFDTFSEDNLTAVRASTNGTDASTNGNFACVIRSDAETVGVFLFSYGETVIAAEDKDNPCFSNLLGKVTGGENSARVMLASILTCDPSLSFSSAKGLAIVAAENGSVSKNGITYVHTFENDTASIGIALDN